MSGCIKAPNSVNPVCLFLQNRNIRPGLPNTHQQLYDALVASKIPTTKVSFQIWKQIEVEGAKSGEYGIWGRTSVNLQGF